MQANSKTKTPLRTWVIVIGVMIAGGVVMQFFGPCSKFRSRNVRNVQESTQRAVGGESDSTDDIKSNLPKPSEQTGGTFIPYSPDKVGQTEITVLDFHASWCASCEALSNDIHEHADQIPANVTILEVDYDKEKDLRKKYSVVTQHTLVWVDKDGNEIKKWIGGNTLQSILDQLN